MVCGLPASSVTVIVTTVPSGSPVADPEIVGVVSFVSPTGSITTVGAAVSTSPVVVAVVSLPALSVTDTSTVNSPSLSSFGTSTLKVPSACTSVVMVCGLPASSVTVIVTTVPSGSPVADPEIVGVVSFVSPTGSITTVGAAVSITPVVVAEASFPAASVAVAVIVNSPSAIAVVAPTCQEPSSATTAVKVCESPLESVTDTVIKLPGSTSVVVPLNTGVESLESVKSFTLIVGAVKSIEPVCESCALLPALSLTFATTLNSPSANVCGTSILHVPSPFIAVTNCCSAPALSVTITVTTLPAAKP